MMNGSDEEPYTNPGIKIVQHYAYLSIDLKAPILPIRNFLKI